MVRYEEVTQEQETRWRLPAVEEVSPYAAHNRTLTRLGGVWLLGQKVVGDQHVPQGEISFRALLARQHFGEDRHDLPWRVCVRFAEVPPHLTTPPTGAPAIHGAVAGEGCLATPGFGNAQYVAGALWVTERAAFRFAWEMHQDTVEYVPVDC